MKLKSIIAAALASSAIISTAVFSAEAPVEPIAPTNGEIQFKGELVNSACGLAANSSPVVIDFGQITTASLKDKKHVGNVQKKIELQHCDTTVAKTAKVTYTPNSTDLKDVTLASFTSGTATGAGIGLKSSSNQPVIWGEATSPVNLVDGTSNISFVAYVKANGDTAITPGTFQSNINFRIDYQ
ncbi:fimbrial protein [Erwinia sorbitola]|uniref:Fimbrial protein n=1 Tax=Erwinia sorbitola TaxID=2681984 RepID=A0A6I6EHY9_9GAMM|nr:fimbrial protein [Erwinia sorbitola]MTD28821.1 fimbrial protein [Erwinia sorbitola]QGU89517.1 fimbrial protein [Erwinia sorbitola]